MEPESKKLSPIEFAKQKLALNPEASYADIKAQAKCEGITIFPVVYGRAKALLGLVPTAPYGSKSKARKKLEEAAENRLSAVTPVEPVAARSTSVQPERAAAGGSGSARTNRAKATAASIAAQGDPAAGLEKMVDDLKTAIVERDRYRAVLERIGELIEAELRSS